MVSPLYIPTSNVHMFQFPRIFTNTVIIFFTLTVLVDVKWRYPTVVLICVSLMNNDAELFFLVLLGCLCICLWRNVYSNSSSVFKLGYLSFYWWILSVLYIFCVLDLDQKKDLQMFSPLVLVILSPLDSVLWSTKVFNFYEVQSIFLLLLV